MQRNILEYLEHTVTRCPDKVAFSGENGALTFGETYAQARSVGSFLCSEGCEHQPVVVFMKKQPKTLRLSHSNLEAKVHALLTKQQTFHWLQKELYLESF